jgi:hypothetical protein
MAAEIDRDQFAANSRSHRAQQPLPQKKAGFD